MNRRELSDLAARVRRSRGADHLAVDQLLPVILESADELRAAGADHEHVDRLLLTCLHLLGLDTEESIKARRRTASIRNATRPKRHSHRAIALQVAQHLANGETSTEAVRLAAVALDLSEQYVRNVVTRATYPSGRVKR